MAPAIRVIAIIVALAMLCVSVVLLRKAFILADQEWFRLWFTGRRISFGDNDSSVLATVSRTVIYAVIPGLASIAILACLRQKPPPVAESSTAAPQ